MAKNVLKYKSKDLCFPSRAWKIRLVDEAADDAGGVFDEVMTEMCQVSAIFCIREVNISCCAITSPLIAYVFA